MADEPQVRVRLGSAFLKNLKTLRKRYRHINDDLQPLIKRLQAGETPGDQVQGTGYTVYKVRLPNRDAQRGKSGGYRVIYYVQIAEQIFLVVIYAKTDRVDISAEEIKQLIDEIEKGAT